MIASLEATSHGGGSFDGDPLNTDPFKNEPFANQDQTAIALTDKNASNPSPSVKKRSSLALQASDTPYVVACRAAGVPIPPAWGDSRWVNQGDLPKGRIFALSPDLKTTLYTFDDPKVAGTCAALPRVDSRGIVALGMICQSADGKACFWDNKNPNIVNSNGSLESVSDPKLLTPNLMADGNNLKENCTGCHRGGNVFIVHSGTVLENIDGETTKKYEPISSQEKWTNPISGQKIAQGCQADCHNAADSTAKIFPDFSAPYCTSLLLPSIKSQKWVVNSQRTAWITQAMKPTMPPADAGYDSSYFATDIQEITDACEVIFRAANPKSAWVWGSTAPN